MVMISMSLLEPVGASTVSPETPNIAPQALHAANVAQDGNRFQSGPVTLKTASRVEEWLDALRLVYDCYVQAGLALPNCHRLRVTPYQLLPKSEVLVGMVADKILCTVTLVPDSEQGLPMEALYDREVAIRRDRGARLAEVSCLADRPDEDRSSFSVLQRLMSFTAQCALRRGVDELLIAVHPRHARFYRRLFAFEVIGGEKTYSLVCDRPAVALSLDLKHLSVDHPDVYQRLFGSTFPNAMFAHHTMPERFQSRLAMILEETAMTVEEAADSGRLVRAA